MPTLHDDLGHPLSLTGPPQCVVSLVPSLTEAPAVTAPGRLAGATDWCTHPAGLDVPRVRGTKNPNRAAITALRPDLVVANREETAGMTLSGCARPGSPYGSPRSRPSTRPCARCAGSSPTCYPSPSDEDEEPDRVQQQDQAVHPDDPEALLGVMALKDCRIMTDIRICGCCSAVPKSSGTVPPLLPESAAGLLRGCRQYPPSRRLGPGRHTRR